MKVNKWIHRGLVFKIENDKMSSKIGNPLPEQDILNTNVKFIQKLMSQNQTKSLHKCIAKPNQSTARIYHKRPKKKLYRMPLEHHIQIYNQLPANIKFLKPQTFSAKLKKITIEYKPED